MSIAIEIKTGKSDFIRNIMRDLKAGYDWVISVAKNDIVETRITETLKRKKIERIRRLKATSIRAFE